MKAARISELQTGDSLRCGRCSDLLPDETQTFCRSCGVPFSQAHPTTSFRLLSEERVRRFEQRRRWHLSLLAVGFFALAWVSYGFVSVLLDESRIAHLSPRMRAVEFYIKDYDQFPRLDDRAKRDAVNIARQAFEDHFGLELKDYSVHEDEWPSLLAPFFEETRSHLEGAKTSEPLLFQLPASKLGFWEKQIFPALSLHWKREPEAPLQVVITNLPIFVERDQPSAVEVRHLSGAGLVSGLGHPGLVLISTYRLENDVPEFQRDRPPTPHSQDKARFLGEYVIAHELGHALLGLSDYILPLDAYPAKGAKLRDPASLGPKNCLMHSDQGGGFKAWEGLRDRALGTTPSCTAYDSTTRAFALRLQALALLRGGQREEAERLHAEALHQVRSSAQDWVSSEWQREHRLFLSVFSRWMRGMFMVQLNHDQL